MWIGRLSSFAMFGGTALVVCLMTGCASTEHHSELAAQCPVINSPDARLLAAPCEFIDIYLDKNDPFSIVVVSKNNQCAREIRGLFIELQRAVKEQLDVHKQQVRVDDARP